MEFPWSGSHTGTVLLDYRRRGASGRGGRWIGPWPRSRPRRRPNVLSRAGGDEARDVGRPQLFAVVVRRAEQPADDEAPRHALGVQRLASSKGAPASVAAGTGRPSSSSKGDCRSPRRARVTCRCRPDLEVVARIILRPAWRAAVATPRHRAPARHARSCQSETDSPSRGRPVRPRSSSSCSCSDVESPWHTVSGGVAISVRIHESFPQLVGRRPRGASAARAKACDWWSASARDQTAS